MFGEDKNLKDVSDDSIKDKPSISSSFSLPAKASQLSYTKTNKLITALFMVTDMIDRDEPLRTKLRTLGTEIISDVHTVPAQASAKIHDVMSFLDIATAINLISDMNRNILKKEFSELFQAIQVHLNFRNNQIAIDNFFSDPEDDVLTDKNKVPAFTTYAGHPVVTSPLHNGQPRTRIGVQKGDTLMKVLSEKAGSMSKTPTQSVPDFSNLKTKRREDIIKILKGSNGGSTIRDINNIIKDKRIASLLSFGEKTLQRELLAMVKDGVLNKTGEKRWSKYFV